MQPENLPRRMIPVVVEKQRERIREVNRLQLQSIFCLILHSFSVFLPGFPANYSLYYIALHRNTQAKEERNMLISGWEAPLGVLYAEVYAQ